MIILKKAMMMEENGKRKRGRPKLTWRKQVEESEESRVKDRGSWRSREGVRAIAEGMRCIRPPSGPRKKTGLKLDERKKKCQPVDTKFIFYHVN